MLRVLLNRTYRHLFAAQVIALAGTGLATVALALLAHDLAGERAGAVLGTALMIKMVAYVVVAPLAATLSEGRNRRHVLIVLDLVRASAALCLPFVSAIWQIYVLIFVLQSASAGFSPAFHATIPDVLPKEDDYTKALSLSRLAYEMENLVSPLLAALLLSIIGYDTLFVGTALGFLGSALLILTVMLPSSEPIHSGDGFRDRTLRGIRLYLADPRLRGLFALCFATSMAGSMVLVNSVVLVRSVLGWGEAAVAIVLASFGAGSMVAALALPFLLDRRGERPVMMAGGAIAACSVVGLALTTAVFGLIPSLLLLGWSLIGVGSSAVLTPSGRLLRDAVDAPERPAIFAAQFAMSHLCWLLAYPLSGWLMTTFEEVATMSVLGMFAVTAWLCARSLWPAAEQPTGQKR